MSRDSEPRNEKTPMEPVSVVGSAKIIWLGAAIVLTTIAPLEAASVVHEVRPGNPTVGGFRFEVGAESKADGRIHCCLDVAAETLLVGGLSSS